MKNEPYISLILSFLTAFIITYISIPSIIRVVEIKNLYDNPNERKLHKKRIPTLGGVAIFGGLWIATTLFTGNLPFKELQYFVAAGLVLFFIGIKDDILIIAPSKKLMGQLIASFIIVYCANLHITNFQGLLGLGDIPHLITIPLTLLIVLTIINGYNFIDGIDGLAAGMGILASLIFAAWFYLTHNYGYAVLAAATAGGLAAFFPFNVFGKKNKIFMGDTGSMTVGLILAICAIRFIETNQDISLKYTIKSPMAVAFSIIFIPVFDLLRITFVRIALGKGISSADKNHIHHRLIRLGFSHLKSTCILLTINVLFITFAFTCNQWGTFRLIMIMLIVAMCLVYIPTLINHIRMKKDKGIGLV